MQQERRMTRFLNLASKALAVFGVLTLIFAGSGMQQAKAFGFTIVIPHWVFCGYVEATPGNPAHCNGVNVTCGLNATCSKGLPTKIVATTIYCCSNA
jgi:hypothetical protein